MNALQEPYEDAGSSALWAWRLRAACRDIDSAVFFSPDGERGPARAAREARAKVICARCPVIRQCAAHAIRYGERYGVWGGLSERERVVFRLRPDRLLAALPVATADPSDEG
jgi:WhiB family transcriptional regulator, redox-sensing transcriptional regulator